MKHLSIPGNCLTIAACNNSADSGSSGGGGADISVDSPFSAWVSSTNGVTSVTSIQTKKRGVQNKNEHPRASVKWLTLCSIKAIVIASLMLLVACNTGGGGGGNGGDTTNDLSISSIQVVSGSYRVDQSIDIRITFTSTVEVTGTPRLTLRIGDASRTAYYTSGSGSAMIVFQYKVVAGDHTDTGIEIIALEFNESGSITDETGNTANTDVPNDADKNPMLQVRIDTKAPVIEAIDIHAGKTTYTYGDTVPITLTWSEPVVVNQENGTPRLVVTVGDQDRTVDFSTSSTPETLVFNYAVLAGDNVTGITVKRLALNGSTIRDAADNEVNNTIPSDKASIPVWISTIPYIKDIDIPTSTSYTNGDTIPITLTWSDPVVVNQENGTLQLVVTVGDHDRTVDIFESSTPETLVFNYAVLADDNVTSITVKRLALNGSTIRDAADNEVNNTIPPDKASVPVQIDTIPYIKDIDIPTSTAYTNGDTVPITLTWSEPVVVNQENGTPRLLVTVGDHDRTVDIFESSTPETLVFNYAVLAGDNVTGITVKRLALNGSTIRDATGNDVNNTIPSDQASVPVQINTIPYITAITVQGTLNPNRKIPGDSFLVANDTLDITITWSEPVAAVSFALIITLDTGEVTAYYSSDDSAPSTMVFRYTIGENDQDVDGAFPLLLTGNFRDTLDSAFDASTDTTQVTPDYSTTAIYKPNTVSFDVNGEIQGTITQTTSNKATCVSGDPVYSTEDNQQVNLNTETGVLTIIAVGDGSASVTATCATDQIRGYYQQTQNYDIAISKTILRISFADDIIDLPYDSSADGAVLVSDDLLNNDTIASLVAAGAKLNYSSSDPTKVTVDDATGQLTGSNKRQDIGDTVTITATLTGTLENYYTDQTASYKVRLVDMSRVPTANFIPFSSWVNASKAELTFPADVSGSYTLFSTSDEDCRMTGPACSFSGGSFTINTFPYTTSIVQWKLVPLPSTTPPVYLTLQDSENTNRVARTTMPPSTGVFSSRQYHQVVVFNGISDTEEKMYLIGGNKGERTIYKDVWSSTEGADWRLVNADAVFSNRGSFQVVVFRGANDAENKMYLIAGSDEIDIKNDVWSSVNGADWNLVDRSADFSARSGYQVVIFNNRMYLTGGYAYNPRNQTGYYYDDVWYSNDGTNWTEATSDNAFTGRYSHQMVVFKGANDTEEKMYLIGGNVAGSAKNDVWSSDNGIDWKLVDASADFPARYGHQVLVFKGANDTEEKMYLIGGNVAGSAKNDVWSSSNGSDWIEVTSNAAFTGRRNYQVVVFNNNMYLIGGYYGGSYYYDDVWRSANGSDWMRGYSGGFVFDASSD